MSRSVRLVQGHWAEVITVNLNSPRLVVKPLLARRGRRLDVGTLLGSPRPLAAVTGAFFDVRSGVVVGSLAYGGRLLEEGLAGSTLTIDQQRRARLLPADGKLGRYRDWSAYRFAVSAGPTLVHRGRLAVNPWQEGFRDPGLFGPRRRTALGVTRGNRLLMVGVASPVDIHTLAAMMRDLGAVEALNMDGGTSATLYYQGQFLLAPKRKLTNLVAIYEADRLPRAALPSRSVQALRHYQRGWEKLNVRLLGEARSHLCKAVALSPRQARYRSGLALVEAKLGHRRAAVDQYLRASRLYLQTFKPAPALAMARKGVALDARRSDAQLWLAQVALVAGQRGLSRQALKAVLALRPGHPGALRLLTGAGKVRPGRRPGTSGSSAAPRR